MRYRRRHDLVSIQQSERFDSLDLNTRNLINSLNDNVAIFSDAVTQQTTVIRELHDSSFRDLKQHIDQRLGTAEVEKIREKDRLREDKILQHLGFPTMEVRSEDISPVHTRTFDWICDPVHTPQNKFSRWLEAKTADQSLFWINGKAGSGKSTLMKYIYEDVRTKEMLSKWAGHRRLTMAAFYFWISGSAEQCSQTGLIRSLLHSLLLQNRQLIRQIFPDLWEALRVSNATPLRAWTLSYAYNALKELLAVDLGNVALFIDGLDEYHGDHGGHLKPNRQEYHDEIVDMMMSFSSPKVKICFSSRPEIIFIESFAGIPSLRLQDLTYNDIHIYVTDKLDDHRMMKRLREQNPCEARSLTDSIVHRADGVFLWVVLAVRSLITGLRKLDTIHDLESRLKIIPEELLELHSYMLARIEPPYLEEGSKIFAMVNASLELHDASLEVPCLLGIWFGLEYINQIDEQILDSPLDGAAIIDAVRSMENKLLTRCGGFLETSITRNKGQKYFKDFSMVLLETTYGNRRLKYLHRSTRDFLELESTRTILKEHMPSDFTPMPLLLWSVVRRAQEVSIEPGTEKWYRAGEVQVVDIEARIKSLALSGLSLAREIEVTCGYSPVKLLEQMDEVLLSRQPKSTEPWTTVLSSVFHMSRSEWPSYTNDKDDLLAVAIVYKLHLYIETKICQNPFVIRQKLGRPYLDYAFSTPEDMDLSIVKMLVHAGASSNEICPNEQHKIWINEIDWDLPARPWTPWTSALHSVAHTVHGRLHYCSGRLTKEQCSDWIKVFKLLLSKGADVSRKIYVHYKKGGSELLPVKTIITTVFAQVFPEKALELLILVRDQLEIQFPEELEEIALQTIEIQSYEKSIPAARLFTSLLTGANDATNKTSYAWKDFGTDYVNLDEALDLVDEEIFYKDRERSIYVSLTASMILAGNHSGKIPELVDILKALKELVLTDVDRWGKVTELESAIEELSSRQELLSGGVSTPEIPRTVRGVEYG
jgi:hypothetical protein